MIVSQLYNIAETFLEILRFSPLNPRNSIEFRVHLEGFDVPLPVFELKCNTSITEML